MAPRAMLPALAPPAPAAAARVRRRGFTALAVLAAALLALLGLAPLPGPAARTPQEGGPQVAQDLPELDLRGQLREALAQVEALRTEVDAGNVVPGFGEKAQEIVSEACARAGPAVASDVELALDGVLEMLFLKQAVLIRQQVAASFGNSSPELASLAQADRQFASEAQELVRPGSSWSFEPERDALRTGLEGAFKHTAALAEERARAARMQHVTIRVIGKLQEKMEQLQQKVQGMRGGGSPWILSTSYRIPNTPLQVVGRYEQGRANLELNLTPDKDPKNSEASFVEGIGPANLGISFNLGL